MGFVEVVDSVSSRFVSSPSFPFVTSNVLVEPSVRVIV